MNDHESLYSRIVLSQKEDSAEDGYLQSYEVFNIASERRFGRVERLQYGIGKIEQGGGFDRYFTGISLRWRTHLVSLWNVEDEATARIMENFYAYLQAGEPKNTALRLAKLDYLKNAEAAKKDPFYWWAPFVLFGNSKPLSIQAGRNDPGFPLLGVLIVLAGSVVVFAFLKRRRKLMDSRI